MKSLSHSSAKPSHYDAEAKYYDIFNEKNSAQINSLIGEIFKEHKVKSVLDLTCGTGSQVFYLAQKGFEVIGVDINANMLKVAKAKGRQKKLNIKFLKGDMRTTNAGKFDAVITIFNAVGHLTKKDFEKAIINVYKNLKEGGLYIFDIFNLSYLLSNNNITNLTIDWQEMRGDVQVRDIQYSTINQEGILASHTISYVQKAENKAKVTKSAQTLQVYNARQLREMLSQKGFKTLKQYGVDGARFHENKTERIMTIAKKLPAKKTRNHS